MKTSASRQLRIVVLAAGFAVRLGQSKPLARVAGLSLLRRTLQATAGLSAGPVIVVVAHRSARLVLETRSLNVSVVANRRRGEGLASSVRSGIGCRGSWSGVLLLPVDLAYVSRRELAALVSLWRAHPRQVIARRVGHQGGTPLILPRYLMSQALTIVGDIGLRELIIRLPVTQRRLIDLPSAEFDIDTPQDLAAARRRPRRA